MLLVRLELSRRRSQSSGSACCLLLRFAQHVSSIISTVNERTHLVVSPDLAHEIAESLVDVQALLRGCLDEAAAKVLCEVTPLCSR